MKTLIAIALATTIPAFSQALPDAPKFFTKTNIALFTGDAIVRTLDAQSTERFLGFSCKCYKEANIPSVVSRGPAAVYGYSLGVSAGVVGLSYVAHRMHHERIAHLIPVIDILYDGHSVLGNYQDSDKTAVTPKIPLRKVRFQ